MNILDYELVIIWICTCLYVIHNVCYNYKMFVTGASALLQRAISAEIARRITHPWTPNYCKNKGICWRGTPPKWHREVVWIHQIQSFPDWRRTCYSVHDYHHFTLRDTAKWIHFDHPCSPPQKAWATCQRKSLKVCSPGGARKCKICPRTKRTSYCVCGRNPYILQPPSAFRSFATDVFQGFCSICISH